MTDALLTLLSVYDYATSVLITLFYLFVNEFDSSVLEVCNVFYGNFEVWNPLWSLISIL